MSVIKKMRRQKAVWWERLEPDQYGRFSFAGPVEVDCRWDDSGTEFRTMQGQTEMSNATVYPDRVMKVGDRLRRGPMDSNEPADPLDITTFEIRRFDQNPNFKATETLYTAYL